MRARHYSGQPGSRQLGWKPNSPLRQPLRGRHLSQRSWGERNEPGQRLGCAFLSLAKVGRKRLSWVSSGLPWFLVANDGVEDGEQLAGGGDDGDDFGLPWATSLSRKALSTGLCREATRAPMKRAARTLALPPPMKLLPRHLPDWRVKGARPASEAIWRRSRLPSSGSSAIRVRAMPCRRPARRTADPP